MTAEARLRLTYVLADYLSTNLALLLFNVFRYYDLPIAHGSFGSLWMFITSPVLIVGQLLFPLVMMGIYYLSGIYDSVYRRSRAMELSKTFNTALTGTLLLFFVALINDLTLERSRDYTLFFALLAILFFVVYIPRLIITWRVTNRMIKGDIKFPALIVGYSSIPQLFPRQVEKISPFTGVTPVALIDSENRSRFCTSGTDLLICDIDDISRVYEEYGVKCVIIIPHPQGWGKTLDVVHQLFRLDVPLFVAAEELPSYMFNARLLSLVDEPLIDITQTRMSPQTLHVKRLADIVVSSVMLVLSAIPMALIGLAIKLDSKGPMFYKQRRVGRHRRQFNIIKLRTMCQNAEADGKPELSYPGDIRVTRVGRILRKYRLDELPQFLNVLRGDMSIVGPRPERPEFMEEMHRRNPAATLIHRVRPGITSLGMVRYGYASNMDEIMRRLQYDLLYLENISILTDLKIILHTANTVLSGKGV